jgi:hypothetical protein
MDLVLALIYISWQLFTSAQQWMHSSTFAFTVWWTTRWPWPLFPGGCSRAQQWLLPSPTPCCSHTWEVLALMFYRYEVCLLRWEGAQRYACWVWWVRVQGGFIVRWLSRWQAVLFKGWSWAHLYNQCLFNSYCQVIWLECESKVFARLRTMGACAGWL